MSLAVPDKPQVFERGDRIYITAPVQGFSPTDQQIEEYAFASQVKKTAPNENLLWLNGQYVEADQANLNGAQWRAGEIALKKLTPMLMPITVMHDPRTAVGTIADVALKTPDQDSVARSRLETILAVWAHRFPEVAAEVTHNLEAGSLMQSMECFSPWYECSECAMIFHKQPHGAERAHWCDHLRTAEAAGYVAAEHQTVAARILGDVCFTGTGLIFGSRGAKGALPTADLSSWQDEVAEIHQRVHTDTARTARSHRMGLVQIEESELATLRQERNDERKRADDEKAAREAAEQKLEAEEAAKRAAEEKAAEEKKRADELAEAERQTKLGSERMSKLGTGFVAKLGDNTKARLTDQAKSMKDEDWEARLVEVEELAGVKRDAQASGSGESNGGGNNGGSGSEASGFGSDEIAAFVGRSNSGGQPASTGAEADRHQVASSVGSLVRSMRPRPAKADK